MTGIRRNYLASTNFVMIHLGLIDAGLSWEAAAVLHRIDYRSGGGGWWPVTKAQMQADMRISERKLDRALNELREHDLLISERVSAETSLMRWRVRYDDDPAGRNVPEGSGTKRPDAEDETSRSSTKNTKKNPPNPPGGASAAADGAAAKQPEPSDDVAAAFADWWQIYPKKVDKKKAQQSFAKAHKRVGYDVLRSGLVSYVKALQADGKVTVTRAKTAHDQPTQLEVRIVGDAKVLNPTTWLNGDRWEDQHDTVAAPAATDDENGAESWMHRTPANTP